MTKKPLIYYSYDTSKPDGDRTAIVRCTELGEILTITEVTLEEMADEYAKLLYTQPNGWGQHVHPVFGRSDNMLMIMCRYFGNKQTHEATTLAVNAEMRRQHGMEPLP